MATSLINTECKRYGCMKNLLACYANCRYNSRCDDLRNEILPNLEQAASDINAYRRERELSAIEIQLMKRGLKFVDVAALQKNLAQGKKRSLKPPRKNKTKIKSAKPQPLSEMKEPQEATHKLRKPARTGKARILTVTRLEKTPVVAQKRSKPLRSKKTLAPVPEISEALSPKKPIHLQEKPRTRPKKRAQGRRKKILLNSETSLKMAKNIKDSETKNANSATEGTQITGLGVNERAGTPRPRKSSAQDAGAKKKKRMFIILDGERSALVDERGLMAKLLAGVSPNARYFEATEIELRLQIAHKK
jgi:hypothetical protein